ncbi:MAG TPA: pentapeptide repeat-containing protein [Candidatus Deferrimicrobium sp.]|nr:pentapeptide repeat-containing protein [Candidatus Deferrimicrobium sp.]
MTLLALALPLGAAADKKLVPLKDWREYTDEEKKFLEHRWSDEAIDAVVTALRENNPLPDFVDSLRYTYRDDTILRADLRGIDLMGDSLGEVNLPHACMLFADLRYADLQGANLQRAVLARARLDSASLVGANLQGANLKYADLQGAVLWNANLQGALLWNANLQGAHLLIANLQGADLGNANLRGASLWKANLQGAYLTEANLHGADLGNANLQGARLWRANLRGASLSFANLHGADLERANLQGANLSFANLHGADLSWADLQGAFLSGAIFENTLLYPPKIDSTVGYGDIEWKNCYVGDDLLTYRDLKRVYRNVGMDELVSEFHYWENWVKTRRWIAKESILGSGPMKIPFGCKKLRPLPNPIRFFFLELTYGYGSRPWWLLWYSLGVVGLFTLVFYMLSLFPRARAGINIIKQGSTRKERLMWRHPHECLYASVVAFATVGYGALRPKQWLQFFRMKPVEHEVVGWVRIAVGLEAALGIWVFALLVTVLFGR